MCRLPGTMQVNLAACPVRVASLVSALVLASCASSGPPPKSQPSPLLSRVLPSFEGKTLNLTPFDSAQADGRPMIVKFFSSDCNRCKSTLPALERIHEDNKDVLVVGVAEDESATEARRLVQNLGVRFPVIHDPTGDLAKRYRVAQMPMTFVIAPNGSVNWVGGPEQTEDGVRAAVSAVID